MSKFLTAAETILRYRICRSTLYKLMLADENTFPKPLRVGGSLRFRECDLLKWENSQLPQIQQPENEEATR